MARKTIYAVQAFWQDEFGHLKADEPRLAKDRASAERLALALSETRQIVLAFSRTVDFEYETYDDPVLFKQYGSATPSLIRKLSEVA